jgi:hypothetical protein
VAYRDADDLLRWIQTVAWRVLLDAQKRDRRLVYEVPEAVSAEDVARSVEHRLRWDDLRALLDGLSADERAALTAQAQEGDRRASTRLAVRRHRVRRKLIAMLDGAAAFVLFVWRWRSGPPTRRAAAVGSSALVVAAAVITASMSVARSDRPPALERVAIPASVEPNPRGAPAHVAATRKAGGVGRPESTSTTAPALPRLGVTHPAPGGTGELWGRPKEAHDHLICLAPAHTASRCADLPIRLTG